MSSLIQKPPLRATTTLGSNFDQARFETLQANSVAPESTDMAVKSHSTSSTVSTPGVPKLHVEGQPIHDDAEEHRNTSNTNQVQQRQPFVDEAGCSVGDDRPPSPQGARRDLSCENGSLDDILRAHSVEHRRSNAHAHRFLGYKRLQRIMTRPRIRNALLKECNPHFECTEAERYCDLILPQQQSPCPPYLRIFAILILADKGHDIEKFLQPVFSDDQFSLDTNVGGLLDEKNLGWRRRDWDIFETYQRKVLVPYFQMSSEVNKSVQNYELHPDTLLPWLAHQSGEGGKDWVKRGGYATVETVKIDADSHDFKSLLDRVCMKTFIGPPSPIPDLFLAWLNLNLLGTDKAYSSNYIAI